jgi:dTDP-4-amino-4,6-dideoxygalactose transaminase
MAVPLLDLQAQYSPLRTALLDAVTQVCDSQRFILGEAVDKLEAELAAYLDVKHAIGLSSGTDALLAAMMALEIGPGDEVITPTFSFFATAGCVARLGATPVFVDIDPQTYNVDPQAVAAAITPRTKAVIPVHLYGQAAAMDALLAVCSKAGVPIIEDACQAIGTEDDGRKVGGIGAFGCFSFFPSKNLGCFGDGGLVTTNDDALAHKLKLIRNHGMEPKYYHAMVGGNFRIDALQAAVLRVKLPHLPSWSEGRRRNAARYRQYFAEAGLGEVVGLPYERPDGYHIYNQFVIRVPQRDALRDHLTAQQIGTDIYYPVPFHRQACFASLVASRPSASFPHADAAAASVLALPIYPELTEAQQREVVGAIAGFYAQAAVAPEPQRAHA